MRAVVTGGARGIGAAVAQRLAADGSEVVRLDLGGPPGTVACDVGDPAQVRAAAAEVGPVDVLVNNAGTWRFAPIEAVTPEDFDAVIRTNVAGAFHCIQAFGSSMLERRRGAIVNVISVAAPFADPGVGAYSASKAALLALTRQVAVEWGPRGVRCNAVGPGLVPTPGTPFYDDPQVRTARADVVPLRRLGTPEDIADVVAFLVSDGAGYVTGQALYVDGGVSQSLMELMPKPGGRTWGATAGLDEAAP